jgi:signal transduction histidine kinase
VLVLIALVAIGSVALATALPSRSWNRHIVAPIRGLGQSARRMGSRRGPAALDAEMIPRELQTAADAYKEVAGAVPRNWTTLERRIVERAVELRQGNQQLIDATRFKSEFLANTSHEIRTPLNAVIGVASVLSDMDLPAEQRSSVETVRVSGHHLLRVISNILDISRI